MSHLVVTQDTPFTASLLNTLQQLGDVTNLNDQDDPTFGYGLNVLVKSNTKYDLDELRAQHPETDFNSVKDADRRKKLLIADMDSTMIPVECIDEIADLAGVKAQVSDITERAMRGELDFEAALTERVGLLKGIPVEQLEQLYQERIFLNPGAETLVKTMNAGGAKTALVSGGFTFFTERVAKDAGFQSHQANSLDHANGQLTGKVIHPILGQQAKLDALETFMQQESLTSSQVIAVGDGANDLMMIKHVDMGVAYRAKPVVAQQAAHIIKNKNFK
jgi:phosphoserine phosphatase